MRENLRLLRLRNKLTQEQMAKALGFSRNHYQRVEAGDLGVSLRFLDALCARFNLTLEQAKELTK